MNSSLDDHSSFSSPHLLAVLSLLLCPPFSQDLKDWMPSALRPILEYYGMYCICIYIYILCTNKSDQVCTFLHELFTCLLISSSRFCTQCVSPSEKNNTVNCADRNYVFVFTDSQSWAGQMLL